MHRDMYLLKIIINSYSIIYSLPRGWDAYMRRILGLLGDEENGFFNNELELDEPTFDLWKSELEKELNSFWRSMVK